jgi:hypothetical protein
VEEEWALLLFFVSSSETLRNASVTTDDWYDDANADRNLLRDLVVDMDSRFDGHARYCQPTPKSGGARSSFAWVVD